MPAGEDGDEQFFQHVLLADDGLGKLRQHALVQAAQGLQLLFDLLIHGTSIGLPFSALVGALQRQAGAGGIVSGSAHT